jgi:hypothetical protein
MLILIPPVNQDAGKLKPYGTVDCTFSPAISNYGAIALSHGGVI